MIFERISSDELETDMEVSQVKKAEERKMVRFNLEKTNDDPKTEMCISVPEQFANQLEPYPRPETRRERRNPYKFDKNMEPRTSARNHNHEKCKIKRISKEKKKKMSLRTVKESSIEIEEHAEKEEDDQDVVQALLSRITLNGEEKKDNTATQTDVDQEWNN